MTRLILLFCALGVATAQAREATGSTKTVLDLLDGEIATMHSLEPTLEADDLGRLRLMEKIIAEARDSILGNLAAKNVVVDITDPTRNLLRRVIVQFSFSKVFFGWEDSPSLQSIVTPSTSGDIKNLYTSWQTLQTTLGLSLADDEYSHITASYLAQMKTLIDSVAQVTTDPEIKAKLLALAPPLGHALSQAIAFGDRPCAWIAARPIVLQVRDLSVQLETLRGSATYAQVLELKGTNSFLYEYLMMDRTTTPGECTLESIAK